MSIIKLQRRLLGGANRIEWGSDDWERLAKYYNHTGPIPPLAVKRSATPVLVAPGEAALEVRTEGSMVVYTWIISTAATDGMNDQISVNGWDLARFKDNPVVQYAHDSGVLPIGRALWTGIEAGRLKSKMVFSADDFAQRVRKMVDERVLRGASVGFNPGKKWEFSKDPNRPGGIDFISGHELLEWSIVNIPANPQCLFQASAEVGRAAADAIERTQPVAAATPFKDEAMRRLAEIKREIGRYGVQATKDEIAARAAALRARKARPGKVNKD